MIELLSFFWFQFFSRPPDVLSGQQDDSTFLGGATISITLVENGLKWKSGKHVVYIVAWSCNVQSESTRSKSLVKLELAFHSVFYPSRCLFVRLSREYLENIALKMTSISEDDFHKFVKLFYMGTRARLTDVLWKAGPQGMCCFFF
jgi:hypothetical protein